MALRALVCAGVRSRLICVLLGLTACERGPAPIGVDAPPHELEIPLIERELAPESSGHEFAATPRVLIELRTGVDVAGLHHRIADLTSDRHERRRLAALAFSAASRKTQRGLLRELDRLRQRGLVTDYVPVSIVNSIVAEGVPAAWELLRRHPDVLAVVPETRDDRANLQALRSAPATEAVAPALTLIGAETAWQAGFRGDGVVVGIIDSGANAFHEQLRRNYLGGQRGWFDPSGQWDAPTDSVLGHGTGVISVAVGANVAGKRLGVAPKARWTACIGYPDGHYHNVALRLCADWMLQQARPDILINPWQLPEAGCDPELREVVEAWRVAGILAVFPSGNQGPGPGLNHSPANYVGLKPDSGRALSVGGLAPGENIYAPSGRGPNACDGSTFPELSAPAQRLTAAYPASSSTYITAEGTSFAAGLVAGSAALLLSAYPEASMAQLEAALRQGTIDIGERGPDNDFGRGRLHVPSALSVLQTMLENPPEGRKSLELATDRQAQ